MALTIRTDNLHRETDCNECGFECRVLVYAANVGDQRGPDGYGYRGEYQYVSDGRPEVGREWCGEQCGDCGNDHYTIVLKGGCYSMVCTDDEDSQRDGCGRQSPIVKMQSHYVSF